MMNLETIVGGYIRGQVITCVLMAVFTFILLAVCGVPNALAIAVFGVSRTCYRILAFSHDRPCGRGSAGPGPDRHRASAMMMLAYEEFESRVLVPVVYGRALRLPSSVVLFSLIAGATLLESWSAPCTPGRCGNTNADRGTARELPGETELSEDAELRKRDDRGEQEYERRTEGMPAEQAAAVAVAMSNDRRKEEVGPVSLRRRPLMTRRAVETPMENSRWITEIFLTI